MKRNLKKLMALGLGAFVIGSGVGAFGNMLISQPNVQGMIDDAKLSGYNEGFDMAINTIEPEVITETVEVIKEVPVNVTVTETVYEDNGNLDMVLDYLEEFYGSELIFEDAKEIVSNIEFEDMLRDEAALMVADQWFDLLDDEGFIDSTFNDYRSNEISLYNVYDGEDIELSSLDYTDEEATVKVTIRVKANAPDEDSVKENFEITLKYDKDGFEVRDVVQL